MTRLHTIVPLLAALVGCPGAASDPSAPASASVSASASSQVAPSASSAAASAAPSTPAPPSVVLADAGPFDVVDLHVDTPWRVHFKARALELSEGDATPDMLRRGHYAAIVYPIYIPDYIHDSHPRIADADAIFDSIDKLVAKHELLAMAVTEGEPKARARVAVADERVAVFVAIEGAGAFAEDITQIDRLIARGVRLVGPVHARDNDLASSATGKKGGYGLTDAGKALCRRVYQAGALVDVSHMSDAAFADLEPIAAEFAAPIVATHSNARALAKHKRNLTDEQLATIGKTGGVAGLNLHKGFVRSGKSKMEHVVAQVKHMVAIAGVDHVAIGTDFDGGNAVAPLKDAGHMQALGEALVADGMSTADVRKIFGANALRVLYYKLTR